MASSMLTLSSSCGLIAEHLTRLMDPERSSRGPEDSRIAVGDFGGCYWRIEQPEEAPTHIRVCLEVPSFADLKP